MINETLSWYSNKQTSPTVITSANLSKFQSKNVTFISVRSCPLPEALTGQQSGYE